jgi:putative transposase
MLAARDIVVSCESVRQWALKFGEGFANQIRKRLPAVGDKWHLDEMVISIAGRNHWLWRAVDQHGVVLDILVQSRRNAKAAKRLLRKLLKKQDIAPRVMITDKLASYGVAKREACTARMTVRFHSSRMPICRHSRVKLTVQLHTVKKLWSNIIGYYV